MAAFAVAMLVLAASPGPGVLAAVAQALAEGFASALVVIAGIVAGDLFFLLLTVGGLTTVAHALGDLFLFVRWAGGLYLLWLGGCLWRAAPAGLSRDGRSIVRRGRRRFFSGFAITLGNPKVILFYAGFLPTFMELDALTPVDILKIAALVTTVLFGVMMLYAFGAARARKVFSSPLALRRLNRGAGTVMIGTGLFLVGRSA